MSVSNLISLSFLTVCFFVSCKTESKTENPVVDSELPVKESAAPKVIQEASLDLTEYGIANNHKNVLGGLKVGDQAPDFSLYDHRGKVVNLSQQLDRGQIILVFYRADWCPYCSEHLVEFKEKLREINENGNTTVIAVSPQSKAYTAEMVKENRFIFPILHDAGHTVMKKYKVFFHVTDEYAERVKKFTGKSLEEMNGNDEPVLCVPATYIIGQDMKINYVHYDPDYTQRADVRELIANL